MTTLEFSEVCPEAFARLPEAYQADSVLFFYEENGFWFCEPEKEEIPILGKWVCYYETEENRWIGVTKPMHQN